MGGIGSGHHFRPSARVTTDEYPFIDIRRWKRAGLLETDVQFVWQWTQRGEITGSVQVQMDANRAELTHLQRRTVGDQADQSYSAFLTSTPCHLGGERRWFVCPAKGCGRRVAILYL